VAEPRLRVAHHYPPRHHRHRAGAPVVVEVWPAAEGRARALGLEQSGAVVEVGPPRPGEPYTDGERWWTLTETGQVQGLLCAPVRGPAPVGARMGAWEVDVIGEEGVRDDD
jgi:hypothetical protein